MNYRKIGKIRSGMLSLNDRFGEVGRYEVNIEIDYDLFLRDRDREGYLKKCIATHLAGCVSSTGIPIGEGIWRVELSDWTTRNFPSLPKEFLA